MKFHGFYLLRYTTKVYITRSDVYVFIELVIVKNFGIILYAVVDSDNGKYVLNALNEKGSTVNCLLLKQSFNF